MSTNSNVKVLTPSGILTTASVKELSQEFNQYLEARVPHILINLENVDFIDSHGLGMLVSLHARARLATSSLYLCSLNHQARCLFEISDMEQVFSIFADQAEFFAKVINCNLAVLVE
ncbi:MAG TPA: STAS domain-containing protein [Leptolyngbyaceae cyanobacterium M33_DOE_097]|uniref:Anti-sigma factor antagonist n=1 Tax=Oscillatoriales cyanobacterium SpSt-418 TaxID=2282169 RepID=A0A7C3KE50_9CYAN|nr:STAS domain-containing protein [Leptolyngbyaceae cyanobacterium M33_DOE_097]